VRDLSTLTAGDFEPLVGTDFDVRDPATGETVVVLRLVEVLRQRERPGQQRQPFVLHFLGPDAPVLNQVVHSLSHNEMGELECFMGPVVAGGPGITYEAVFS
jgi:hypothetical protein